MQARVSGGPVCCILLALLVSLLPTVVLAGDHLFNATFDAAEEGPYSDAEAARFLTQATFGATTAEIGHLRSTGYHAWLDEQFNMAPTLHRPFVQAIESTGEDVFQNIRREAWWTAVMFAPDQLRQRVAFALSELLVVSDQDNVLKNLPEPLAHYYDILLQGAFGNYRDLLEEVTLSPVMGFYLSMFRNQKPDPVRNIRPDENYAREVMQLFSIGLVQLNLDGTPLLEGGDTVPTYSQDTISGFAHVFTGWNFANCSPPQQWEGCRPGPVPYPIPGWDAYTMVPMEPWEDYHASASDKQLLVYPGVDLAAGILPAGGTAQADLDAALDNIFHHPNVGPFIARHLITRLVTSNPSPEYVARVAAVFNNNGSGVRGDLGATVNAVLLDPEARVLPLLASNAGKLREPLLRQSQLFRALDAHSDDGRFRMWGQRFLGQQPLGSPSVFNFFLPDYSPPGELYDLGLLAPEFQITTDTTIASAAQGLGIELYLYWSGNQDQLPEDIVVDLAAGMALADEPVRLVDYFDLLLMNRSMSDFMFDTLVAHVEGVSGPGGFVNDDVRRLRVQDTVWLIITSPEYVIER